jgi:hypothetical protein
MKKIAILLAGLQTVSFAMHGGNGGYQSPRNYRSVEKFSGKTVWDNVDFNGKKEIFEYFVDREIQFGDAQTFENITNGHYADVPKNFSPNQNSNHKEGMSKKLLSAFKESYEGRMEKDKKTIADLKESYGSAIANLKTTHEAEINVLGEQIIEKDNMLRAGMDEILKLRAENEHLSNHSYNLGESFSENLKELREKEEEIEKLQRNQGFYASPKNPVIRSEEDYDDGHGREINELRENHDRILQQLRETEEEKDSFQGQYQKLQEEKYELTETLEKQKERINEAMEVIENLQEENNNFHEELDLHKNSYEELVKENARLQNAEETLEAQYRGRYQAQEEKRQTEHDREMDAIRNMGREKGVLINNFFDHEMLVDRLHHKKFLTEAIEQEMNWKIKRTKLLCQYDSLSKVNFHKYIDGIKNIVVIIETLNRYMLAGFTEDSFKPSGEPSKGTGLIMSLTSGKVFKLLGDKKAISYDDYYMIFGNSEIRLKTQETTVFSNLGIANRHYNTENYKVNILLGEKDKREVDIKNYEIYEVFFDTY